jgi:arylsulfatase A-like enzyme
MYCLLAYIPTTYFAFIQAPFLAWMPAFARLQPYLFTVTFCGAAIPLWERYRAGHDRRLILEFWLIGLLGSACLMWMRPVQSLANNSLSFVWAIAFLLPVICLGALDYAGYLGKLKEKQEASRPFSYGRVIAASLLVSVLYPGSAFLRFYIARMPSPLTRNELAICIWAAITQVLLFLFVASIVELARRAADRSAYPEAARFLLYTGLWWLGLAFSLFKVVLASIPFAGTEGAVYACLLSMAVVVCIGGRRLRRRVQRNYAAAAGERQPKQSSNVYEPAALFLLIFAAALIVPLFIGSMDWHSILEKTWAMVFWIGAAALMVYRQPFARRRLRAWHILLVAFMSLAVFRAGLWSQKSWAVVLSGPNADAGVAVRRHETFDASFAAANELMTPASSRPCDQNCQFISNQTNIPASARVDLHDVSLVHNLQPNHGSKPNIFIIVVDSLRRDYLSPYNPSVDFTPAIGAFAKDSIVFRNSFTRYSGTTLSEPSIWAGMLMLHKHYVQPFHLVNNLEKMIQADDYQSMVSVDTVLRVVLQPRPDLVQLDTGEAKWTDQDFCSTSAEAASRIAQRKDRNRPIFLYTQPQNVHFVTLSKTALLRPPKKQYGSFLDFYASELERLDGCFGNFIGALKAQGLYENSIIVLTADHGEALEKMGGERHAFSLKPEVIQVPLIMHVPPAIRKSWYYDQDLIAFNTDITATLHEILGHGPVIARPEFGRPLITPNSDEMQKYKQDSYLIASSYGFVYGVLFDNGKKLFVDTQGEREFFDLNEDPAATHNVLTKETRIQSEAILRNDIQRIADLYGYRYTSPDILEWLLK